MAPRPLFLTVILCAGASAPLGLAWTYLRAPRLPAESPAALETALAQGFLEGFSIDPHESPVESASSDGKEPRETRRAEQLYRDALILYVQREPTRAIALLKEAGGLDPGNERVHNALARIKQETGQ